MSTGSFSSLSQDARALKLGRKVKVSIAQRSTCEVFTPNFFRPEICGTCMKVKEKHGIAKPLPSAIGRAPARARAGTAVTPPPSGPSLTGAMSDRRDVLSAKKYTLTMLKEKESMLATKNAQIESLLLKIKALQAQDGKRAMTMKAEQQEKAAAALSKETADAKEAQILDLQKRLATVSEEDTTLRQKIASDQDVIAKLLEEKQELEDEYVSFEERVYVLEDEKKQLESRLDDMARQIATAQHLILHTTQEKKEVELTRQSQTQEVTELEDQNVELEEQTVILQHENSQLTEELSNMARQLAEAQHLLTEATAEAEHLRTQVFLASKN